MTFTEWLEETLALQREAFGQDPLALEGAERADWFMTNLLAAHAELVELGDECGWKPWTSPRGWVKRDAFIGEAVDLMHFIGNLLVTVECGGDELADRYRAKVEVNRRRQANGDDGITRRCTGCKRSYDDVGVVEVDDLRFCGGCGQNVLT